jgi:excisionase family DNA binding protein
MMPKKKQKTDKMLPVSTVAKRLSVSRQTIYNLILAGALEAIRTGPAAGIRIFESSLDDFLKKRKNEE